ncbi:MAG: hypothetical protein LUE93_08860 [Bacteroides sp.]|nr:hypothetical protein [Bacteroides sp.]
MDLRKLLMMVLVAVLPLGFIACDDDDDDNQDDDNQEEITLAEQVIGKWEITKIQDLDISAIISVIPGIGDLLGDIELVIELKDNGELIVANLEDRKGTYTVSETNETVSCDFMEQTVVVTEVAVDNNTLTAKVPLGDLDFNFEEMPDLKDMIIGILGTDTPTITCKKQ